MAGNRPVASWVPIAEGSPFALENLPYSVFSPPGGHPRVGVGIGDQVVDLAELGRAGLLDDPRQVWDRPTLNAFMAEGPAVWSTARRRLSALLTDATWRPMVEAALRPQSGVTLHLPFEVADYVDFFSSLDHARNMGRILRPGTEPLSPNWRHLPTGYHGRAGTVVVAGTPVVRPSGQMLATPEGAPVFGPTRRLDFEAEVGFVVGVGTPLGQPVAAGRLAEHVFGAVLVNDWSARDIQAWEYVPLGPLLGKSFATSISPWVVPLEALAPARVSPPPQDPPPLPYLHDPDPWSLELTLEVRLNGEVVSRPPFSAMYWTPGQQLAHLTANGSSLRTGDLLASGTVSGPAPDQRGSLIELAWNGSSPVALSDGSVRSFLLDGDTVTISAWASGAGGVQIGMPPVTGTIVAAGAG